MWRELDDRQRCIFLLFLEWLFHYPQKEYDFSIDSEKSKRLRTKDLNSLKLKENDLYSSSQHGRRREDEYINR